MCLILYVFLTHASIVFYLLIICLSSIAFNTMNSALSPSYRSVITTQKVAAQVNSLTGAIFQVSSAVSPIAVGLAVEFTHNIGFTLLAPLSLSRRSTSLQGYRALNHKSFRAQVATLKGLWKGFPFFETWCLSCTLLSRL